MDIPVISRLYLTGAFLTTTACAVDLVTPFSLYFNWDLIFIQGQVWRYVPCSNFSVEECDCAFPRSFAVVVDVVSIHELLTSIYY